MKSLMRFIALAVFCLAMNSASHAQTTAASYPYTAFNDPYTYLTGGTRVTAIEADDRVAQNIPIGFNFVFCGQTYSTVTVSSNGWMSFINQTNSFLSNRPTSNIFPAVMPLWDDLDGRSGSSFASYRTIGTAPNRIFIFEWKDWEWRFTAGTKVISFQVKLYEGGVIDLTYKRESGNVVAPSATIGIARNSSDFLILNNSSPTAVASAGTFTTNINAKPVDGQVYRFGQIPCSGTPSTHVVGPTQVCPNRLFTQTLAGVNIISGLTYQWQYTDDGTNWSNFSGIGATTSAITDSITAMRWYRCVVTCTNSGLSYTTTAQKVTIAPFYYCYCITNTSSPGSLDIGNVTIISNQSKKVLMNNGNATPRVNNPAANNSYTEYSFSVPPVTFYRDSTYEFRITEINSGPNFETGYVTAYIDFNRDGIYDTAKASGEKIFAGPILGTNNPAEMISAMMEVPSSANIGLTGMRIILGKQEVDPCGTNVSNGEIEDYIVKIDYRPCDGPVNTGTVLSSDTSMCKDYNYIISNTTYENMLSGIERRWEVSGDNINWQDIANSSNKDSIQRYFVGQPLYYRLRTICPVSDDTTYSTSTFVKAKAGYKCYCYSQAEGGKGVDTSDIGGITIAGYSANDGGAHLLNPKAILPRTDRTDDKPIELFTDSVYKFTVFHTLPVVQHGDARVTVFVDFNNNKEYDTPDERIFTGFTTVGSHTLVDNLQIPYNVITDVPTGMRFILNNNVGPNVPSDEACGGYTSGETEDIMVIFRRKYPVTISNTNSALTGFGLYPNPTTGKFHVQFNTPNRVNDVQIRVTNVTGQQVLSNSYMHDGGLFDQSLSLENQPSGVYFVELQMDGQKLQRKLLLQ